MDLESLSLADQEDEPAPAPEEMAPIEDDGADLETYLGTDDPEEVDTFVRAVKAAMARL